MRNRIVFTVSAALITPLTVLALGDYGKDQGKCLCPSATASTVAWCDHCGVGMAYGHKLKSKDLTTALAGHAVESEKVKCPGCRTALKDNTRCDHCKVGFNNGVAYHSPVSLALSKGQVVSADEVHCARCKTSLEKGQGFCSHCNAGVVNGMVFKSEDDYKAAKKANTVLAKATKASAKCEGCAVAMVSDGHCDGCHVAFKDGKPAKHQAHDHGH